MGKDLDVGTNKESLVKADNEELHYLHSSSNSARQDAESGTVAFGTNNREDKCTQEFCKENAWKTPA